MRYLLLQLLLLPVLFLHSQHKTEVIINENFRNVPFIDAISTIENNYPVNFFYKAYWISDLTISGEFNQTPINQFLSQVREQTGIGFYIKPENQIILLPKDAEIKELPEYLEVKSETTTEKSDSSTISLKEQYIKGRKPNVFQTISIGRANDNFYGKYAFIKGQIQDENSGEPVIGATMYIEELKKGAASDINGSISMAIPPGKYTAQFRCMGMADIDCFIQVHTSGYFELKMNKAVTAIKEVTINAANAQKRSSKIGLERVSIKQIKNLPVLMGEKDVIKVSQMLPGVVSTSEASAGVNVRGGNADQNLFYLNGIPIYNTSHLFGFFSAVNSSIIKDFSIYKAHIPAEYGGRLSSIFNVDTKKGNKKKLFMQGGVSPVTANIAVETPVVKEKVSVILSARSTYSDWILNRIEDPEIRNSDASFYDISGGIDYRVNEKNMVNFFMNYSNDHFNQNKLTQYDYSNLGYALKYKHFFNTRLDADVSLVNSTYKFKTIDEQAISEAYKHNYKINHLELKAKTNWVITEKHKITVGLNAINYDLDRGIITPYGEESNIAITDLGKEHGIESAFFIDEQYTPTERITLSLGFRLSSFWELGPKTSYTYQSGSPRENPYIIDTTFHKSGEIISNFNNPEFRVGLNYKPSLFNAVKFSFTQMSQYLFMLSNTISIGQNDQWKMVDQHIDPPKLWQLALGYYQQIPALNIAVNGETYYKKSNNIVEYKDGADFISSPNVETTLLQGDQNAYGFELMVTKEDGKLNGWISYTFSKSTIQVDGENDWDKINFGKPFLSNYDKPHVLNFIANYRFNRRFTFSANITYSTGRPITYPQSIFYINQSPYVEYSERNKYRIPNYFRTDLSLTIDGNLKKKKLIHSYWLVSVYNATGRKNANSIFFQSENGIIKGYKYSIIGVPIFTISWNFKLGNYTNE